MSSEKSKILEAAQQYTIRGQTQKAIEEWKKLLTNTPNDANIYNTIGDLSLKNPSSSNTSSNTYGEAVLFYIKAAEIFESSGFVLKAIAMYKKVLKIMPDHKEIYLRLGNLNCERGLIGNAREDYLMAAKLYSQDGLIKGALDVYRKIADLDPSNLSVRTKIAEMFLKEGMKNEAIGEYNKIASAHLKAGRRDDAEKLYDLILDLQPDNVTAIVEAGRFHLENGKLENALEYGKKAYALSADSQEVLSFLVDAYNSAGIFDKAEEILYKIIAINPALLSYKETLASILLNKGDTEKAALEYFEIGKEYLSQRNLEKACLSTEKAIEISSDLIDAHELLFDIYLGLDSKEQVAGKGLFLAGHFQEAGDIDKARGYYLKILNEDPYNAEAKERLNGIGVEENVYEQIEGAPEKPVDITVQLSSADVYLKYGLMEKAIAELLNIVNKIDPNNEVAHIKLKDVYHIMGEEQKVIEECFALLKIFDSSGEREKMEKMINEVSAISSEDRRIKVYKDKLNSLSIAPLSKEISDMLEEAGFYAQQGMVEEAIEVYEKVLRIDSTNEEALSRVRLFNKTLPQTHLPEVEIIKPEKESPAPFFDLGEMLKEEVAEYAPDKPFDEIFKEFNQGIKAQLGTEDYESHYDLGISYKEMGLFREAIDEFKSCGNVTPRFLDASYFIAVCHKELGEYIPAVDALEKAIASEQFNDKSHIALKYEMGTLLQILGRKEDALLIFQQIDNIDSSYRDVSEKVLYLQRGRWS